MLPPAEGGHSYDHLGGDGEIWKGALTWPKRW